MEVPFEHRISRVCEEFRCTPARAAYELENDPDHLIERVMLVRSFERAYGLYKDSNVKAKDKKGPMVALVRDIEFALVKEQMKK